MTPFDPWALLAMLQAFYPIPSGASLVRASRERPEYFAGGLIVGSKLDKLQLPDGRFFDFIFAAGGLPGQQRWQVLDVTHENPEEAGEIPLEPGPLTPIDELMPIFPPRAETFESFVGGELAALEGADGVLHRAGVDVVDADIGGAIDASYRARVEPAADAHAGIRRGLDADDPADEVAAAQNHGGKPGTARQQYDEPEPPAVDEPDPGRPPGDDEDTPPGTRHPKDEDL